MDNTPPQDTTIVKKPRKYSNGRPRVYHERQEEILVLRSKGYTVRAIALALGLTKSTVHVMLSRKQQQPPLTTVQPSQQQPVESAVHG